MSDGNRKGLSSLIKSALLVVIMASVFLGAVYLNESSLSSHQQPTQFSANTINETSTINVGSGNQISSVSITQIPPGPEPSAFAFDSQTSTLFVTNYGSNSITAINASANYVSGSFGIRSSAIGIAFDPSSKNLYVVNNNQGTLTVISTLLNKTLFSASIGSVAQSVTLDPFNGQIFVSKGTEGLTDINGSTMQQVSGSLFVRHYIVTSLYNPDNHDLYVADATSQSILVLSPELNLLANVSVGSGPSSVAYDSDNHYLYVDNFESNSVSVISTMNNTVVASIAVDQGPFGICYLPSSGNVFVTNSGSSTISEIKTSTNTVSGVLQLSPSYSNPSAIFCDSKDNKLFVAEYATGNVSAISFA